MGFVYNEQELELVFNGQTYKFKQPSAFEQKEISRQFREATPETDVVDLYIGVFVKLGLPEEILGKMSLQGLVDLFAYAVGSKKN